eukprot:1160151-Pelagomonas_calceolata.AAC.6
MMMISLFHDALFVRPQRPWQILCHEDCPGCFGLEGGKVRFRMDTREVSFGSEKMFPQHT